jgi:hypothetical protein
MVTGDFSFFTGVNLIVGTGAELQLGPASPIMARK